MPMTEVQHTADASNVDDKDPKADFASAPTAGNLLICVIGWNEDKGDATLTMVSPGWVRCPNPDGDVNVTGKIRLDVFIKTGGVTEPQTVQGRLTSSRWWNIYLLEVSAITANGWATDVSIHTVSSSGSTSPSTGTTSTTGVANEYWVAPMICQSKATFSAPTNSFVILDQIAPGGSNNQRISGALLGKIVTATGTAGTAATLSNSRPWIATIITIKQVASTVSGVGSFSGIGSMVGQGQYATPTIVVQAGFGFGPGAADPDWTTISSYVRSFGWSRGRQNELNQTEAGTAGLVIADPNSAWDPNNTSSPFYPNVRPGTPIRALAFNGGNNFPLFRGTIERIPRTLRVTDHYTERQIDIVDGYAVLASAGLGGMSFPQESSDLRVTEVLDKIGWPALNRNISAGDSTLQAMLFDSDDDTRAQAHLQAVIDSENGFGFVDASGKFTFVGRTALASPPWTTSQARLADIGVPPLDAQTVLLLHGDGTDTSTTFIDSSSAAHAMTANGNAQVDTAQSKFGGASALFDGTGDYISTPDSADWAFGSGNFTIDMWARWNVVGTDQCLISQWNATGNQKSWELTRAAFNNSWIFAWTTDGATEIFESRSFTPNANQWYHVAFVRSGTVGKIFVDGTQIGTNFSIGSATFFDSTSPLNIGIRQPAGNEQPFNGWLDEIRISKGVARWTSNFTPPIAPYHPVSYPYTDLVPSYDLDHVFNRFIGTRTDGSPQMVEDTTSQSKYFLRVKQLQSLSTTDSEVVTVITALLARYKDPMNRVESLEVMPLADTTNSGAISTMLSLEVADRITILEMPPGFGTQQSADYIIQKIEGEISPGPILSMKVRVQVWPA